MTLKTYLLGAYDSRHAGDIEALHHASQRRQEADDVDIAELKFPRHGGLSWMLSPSRATIWTRYV